MSRVIVAKYGAKWCGPCHKCNPDFARVVEDFEGKGVDFYQIDIDEPASSCPEKILKCIEEISSIPYFAIFPSDESEKKVSIVGWKEDDLRLAIECALPKNNPKDNEAFIRPGTLLSSSDEEELDQYVSLGEDEEDEVSYVELPKLEQVSLEEKEEVDN